MKNHKGGQPASEMSEAELDKMIAEQLPTMTGNNTTHDRRKRQRELEAKNPKEEEKR